MVKKDIHKLNKALDIETERCILRFFPDDKEDCADLGYSKNGITEPGAEQRRFMNIPNCRIHKMSLCGCSETCSYYSVNVLAVSE